MDENEKVVVLPDNPVRCALMRAAEIVEERWCQGTLGTTGGPVCALGAISEVTDGTPTAAWVALPGKRTTAHLAREALERQVADIATRWNDTDKRTNKEVAAAMRRAAVKAD